MTSFSSQECQLSIVIPAYNYAAVVGRAIDSVMTQMNEATELIVVDDGSSDETPVVLAALAPKPTFRVVRQGNAGPAAARNHGLRLATGKYILFLDADDELLPGAVDAILSTVKKHPYAGLLLGAHINRFPDDSEKLAKPTPVQGNALERINDYLLRRRIAVQHGACVFRRDIVAARPYPEHLRQMEDIPVFAHLVAHAVPALIPQPLARIHKHPDSLRHNANLAGSGRHALVDEVFASLPAECQSLRPAYETQRMLSAFRKSCQAGNISDAEYYFRTAFRTDWRRAIKWKYLGKYLRLWLLADKNR